MTNPTPPPSDTADIALGPARSSARLGNRKMWITPSIGFGALVIIAVLGLTLDLGTVTTLTTALMYITIAQGWNLLGGFGGYLNFGAAIFVGAGAYTAAYLNSELGWSLPATLIPAALVAVACSVLVGIATLRLRSHYFAIFTLILTFLAASVIRNTDAVGGARGIFITMDGDWTPGTLGLLFFGAFFLLAVAATAIAWLVQRSNFGYALRAIKEDETAARALGVKTVSVKLRALVIGAVLAGIAGAIFAFQSSYLEPAGAFDLYLSLDIVLVCVIGGLGSWAGAIVGSILLIVLEQVLRLTVIETSIFGWEVPEEINRVILGVILILFALFLRQGVMGLVERRSGKGIAV